MNPNKLLLKQLVQRVAWDLRPEARRSRKILRSVKGSQAGRKAVVLCNGPSLLETDFDRLAASGAYVIGLNKINLLFDKTDLRPDAIVAVNAHVIEQNADFFNETEIPLFLSHQNHRKGHHVKPRPNIAHLCVNDGGLGPMSDVTYAIHEGCTVTPPALQLAVHLGCSSIGIVGCDHNFATKGEAHKAVKAGDTDPNHFDPKYFSGGVTWQLPDLLGSEVSYMRTRLMAERNGIGIWNCTAGGKLEVFERQSLEDFLDA